jgi:hypothetical protein
VGCSSPVLSRGKDEGEVFQTTHGAMAAEGNAPV